MHMDPDNSEFLDPGPEVKMTLKIQDPFYH